MCKTSIALHMHNSFQNASYVPWLATFSFFFQASSTMLIVLLMSRMKNVALMSDCVCKMCTTQYIYVLFMYSELLSISPKYIILYVRAHKREKNIRDTQTDIECRNSLILIWILKFNFFFMLMCSRYLISFVLYIV